MAIVALVLSVTLVPISDSAAVGAWAATDSLKVGRARHTATLLGGPACREVTAPAYCGRVLVAGGERAQTVATNSVELFDPETGEWSSCTATPTSTCPAPLSKARRSHTATLLDGPPCFAPSPPAYCGKVLVVGGIGDADAETTSELYDPATGTWTPGGELGTPRVLHAAASLEEGGVLVVGGDSGATAAGSSELYDPVTNEWTSGPAPNVSRRSGHTATLLYSSKCNEANPPLYCGTILLVGGRPGSDSALTKRVEIFSPVTSDWEEIDPLSEPVADHSAVLIDDAGCDSRFACGDVMIVGGTDAMGTGRSAASLFEPPRQEGTGEWDPLASMSGGRHFNAAALLPNGRVLVTGGGGPVELDEDAVEYFDPLDKDWIVAGYMTTARYLHTATTLPDGRVLVAGGAEGNPVDFQESAELFDPAGPTYPSRVENLQARLVSASEAELKWSAPGMVEGSTYPDNVRNDPPVGKYVVRHSTAPIDEGNFDDALPLCGGVCEYSPRSRGTELRLYVEELQPDRTHYFAIESLADDGGLGEMSDVVHVSTPAVSPGRVEDLTGTAITGRKIRLAFGAVGSDGGEGQPVQKYVIRQSTKGPIDSARKFENARRLCDGVCDFGPEAVGDELRLTVTNLRPRTTYYYALRAKDDEGNLGRLSDPPLSVRTPRDQIAPGKVRALKVSALSSSRLRVAFDAAASDGSEGPPVRDYIVKQARHSIDRPNEFKNAGSLCKSACRFSPARVGERLRITVTGLCPGTTYHYAIRARDEAGNLGKMSDSRKATTEGNGRC